MANGPKIGAAILPLLHGSHWLFYAMLLSYAIPPIPASVYAADGVLVLWCYLVLFWYDYQQWHVLAALAVLGDAIVAAETLDVYRETQRSLTQGRATVHLALMFYSYISSKKT